MRTWPRSTPRSNPPTARARRTTRIRRSCVSAPTSRCRLDAGVDLSPVPDRLPDLRHAQRRAQQRGADLPRAHRRPARRQRASGHRQSRLVGDHGRARPADRHRALFRHLPERGRRLHGHDRPGLDQPEDRHALGPRLSRSSRSATWCARRRCCSTISASTSLFAVAGGSMGGMQVLQWAASYPERVFAALPIAAATRHSAQNIAFHEVGRQAVMADPEWRAGPLFRRRHQPAARARGRAHGRAHHLSLGRRRCTASSAASFQDRDNPTFSFDADFQVESYLRHQGITFVERFDANSYLYLTRAMDYFRPRGRLRRRARQCLPRTRRRASA